MTSATMRKGEREMEVFGVLAVLVGIVELVLAIMVVVWIYRTSEATRETAAQLLELNLKVDSAMVRYGLKPGTKFENALLKHDNKENA
jgi:hypothetical protein